MNRSFDHFESVYWVFTQLCNDRCAHCYNDSSPQGTRITTEDCLAIVHNLPSRIDRLILSGGEPLTERPKLYAILDAVRSRYGDETQIMLQTNGDLINEKILDELIARGVTRFDIASIDRYHKNQGQRQQQIETLFRSRGMVDDATAPLVDKEHYLKKNVLSFGFWGANENFWIGGNWARGNAMRTGTWLKNGRHNFCAILSGARGFLGGTELPQEISIQLWKINPCCPGTLHPMGDARVEKASEVIERVSKSEVFQRLNEGDAYAIGESLGLSRDYGLERADALQNICLWCDEFFDKHFDIRTLQPKAKEDGELSSRA